MIKGLDQEFDNPNYRPKEHAIFGRLFCVTWDTCKKMQATEKKMHIHLIF